MAKHLFDVTILLKARQCHYFNHQIISKIIGVKINATY